jgi:hypothetical protein
VRTEAEVRRLTVLRRIGDVVGDRMYESMTESRSVRSELVRLERDGLIERYIDAANEPCWRRTTAGDERLAQG